MSVLSITKDSFKDMIGGPKPALIEFYAPWCTYCRRIAPAFGKVAEQYADKLTVGQINIDVCPELAEAYQVEVVPTLVVFKNGEPVGDAVAPESKAKIEDLIRQYVEDEKE